MGSGATNGVTKASACNITGQLASNTPLSNIVSPHASGTDNIPKSYLSVLFFDERFNFVSEGSTSQRVSGADNSNAALTLANIKAPKNGYAYIYVSNESDEYVYFDNVKVAHTRGRIIEENHYYAFGLKIAGISSKKLGDDNEGSLRNEYGYNDKELWEEGDLNWLDYGFRNYDPQIGRFLQIDPLSDDYADLSPYLYAYNDPIANVDEDGLFASSALNAVGQAVNNTLPEVIVKSTIKKAASKSIGKIILTKIAENSVSLFGSLINSGNNFVDKGKEIYNRVSLNITLEDARTGTTFGERFLKEAMSMENVFGGIASSELKIGRKAVATAFEKYETEQIVKEEAKTIYERVMSKGELDVTLEGEGKNLLRGGREGENFFSKAGTISNDAKRVQQRLGLDGKLRDYKVKFTIQNPKVKVSGPRTAKPGKTRTSGGGLEYSTKEATKIKIISVSKLKNRGL
jgi:RHS repeat-associated protein